MESDDKRRVAELKEWFGITVADAFVWVSFIALIAIFVVRNSTWDAVLSGLAVVCAIIACPLGMKANVELSEFTNQVKRYSYIPYVLFTVIVIAAHYLVYLRFVAG